MKYEKCVKLLINFSNREWDVTGNILATIDINWLTPHYNDFTGLYSISALQHTQIQKSVNYTHLIS